MKKTLKKYSLVLVAGLTILLLTPTLVSQLQETEIAADIHKIERASDPYLYQYDTPTFDLFAGEEKGLPNFKITQEKRSLDFNVIVDPNPTVAEPNPTPEDSQPNQPAEETNEEADGLGFLESLITVQASEEIKVVDENTDPAIEYTQVNESTDFVINPDQNKVELTWDLSSKQDLPSLEFETEKLIPSKVGETVIFSTRTQRKAFEIKDAKLSTEEGTLPAELLLTQSDTAFSITFGFSSETVFPSTLSVNIVSLFHERMIDASPLESDFSALEKPQFLIDISEVGEPLKSALINREYENLGFGVIDTQGNGRKIPAELVDSNGDLIIRFTRGGTSIKPGLYDLLVQYKEEPTFIGTEEFSWGVLAMNPDQSIYRPGQTSRIDMAVLNNLGNMVCDASLQLDVTDPVGIQTTLSTKNSLIKVSPECNQKETDLPDFTANYKTGIEGDYKLTLSAVTENGEFSIDDSFKVDNNADYYIKRDGPTRIYPPKTYTMNISIEVNSPTEKIVETVPADFEIMSNSAYTLDEESAANKKIIWNTSLKKGEKLALSYSFKAPDRSPALHFVGPLKIDPSTDSIDSPQADSGQVRQEDRKWQIAGDAVGDIGIWRDSAGGQFPGTSWGAMNFATQQRNDGDYTFTGGNTLELDVAGNYLLIGTMYWTDDSNGRWNPECRFNYTGSGNFQTVYGSGYSRNNNNDEAWCRTMAVVWGNAANDTVQLQVRRDTNDPTNGSIADNSHFQVVRLPEGGAVGMYYDNSDTSSDGGISWNEVPFNTAGYQSDTSVIELQTDDNLDIRLKKDATNFLIAYSVAYNNTGSRTQRVSRMETGGSGIAHSYGYSYCRNGNNQYCDPQGMFLYRNSGTTTDLTVQVQRDDADVDGTTARRASESGMFIIELPPSAEIFISHDSTAGQDIGGTAGDFNLFRTGDIDYNDSAAFTRSTDTAMNCEKTMDVMLMAQIYVNDTTETNARLTVGTRFEIQGVDQTHGEHGAYLRGLQGNADTYNWAASPAGFYACNSGDDVQVEWWDQGDNGNTPLTQADKVGFGALNLDSLDGGGPATPTNAQLMRHGTWFDSGVEQPMTF